MKRSGLSAVVASALVVVGGLSFTSPPLSDVIQWGESKEYLVNSELHIEAYQDRYEAAKQYEMNLKDTPLVFPVVVEGGSSELDAARLNPRLYLDDHLAKADFKLINAGSSSDSQLARFAIEEFKGKQIDVRLDEYLTCYDMKVDEKRAQRIGWPDSWDDSNVQSALEPQMYIESTNESIAKVASEVVGKEPKKIPPYVMAKLIARETVMRMQVSGTSISKDRYGKIDGLNVQGAERALARRRGTLFDAACAFVALSRASGLPARPVIVLDNEDNGEMIAWVEFYLPTAGWVSIDLRELIAGPGMMKQLNRPWKGFGTNDELDQLVPIAHHFHPPFGVLAGGLKGKPMLWGWIPVPEHTPNNQRLRFVLQDAPKRASTSRKKMSTKRGSGK